MRVLVVGAGVIGNVYAGKLLAAAHEVVLLARGRRLADLQTCGLILEEAVSERRTTLPVAAVDALDADEHFDLLLRTVISGHVAAA